VGLREVRSGRAARERRAALLPEDFHLQEGFLNYEKPLNKASLLRKASRSLEKEVLIYTEQLEEDLLCTVL
jgi:hypothetical protein